MATEKKQNSLLFSVVIPVYGQWETLVICLEHCAQLVECDGLFEVIVVDNEPLTAPIVSLPRYPFPVTVIREPRPGSYRARNAGAAVAKGRYLAFTDADCQPDSRWLAEAEILFHKGADIIAGNVVSTCDSTKRNLAEAYGVLMPFNQEEVSRRGEALTANLIVRSEVFRHTGGFRSDMFSSGDVEWSGRASKTHRLMYGDQVRVSHPVRSTLRDIFHKRRRIVGGMMTLHAIRGTRRPWLTDFLPPRLCITVWSLPGLSLYRKGQIALLRYAVQLYGTWHRILLTAHITQPSRS